MLHVFVIGICIFITIFLFFEDFMGLNFYGLCSLTPTRKTTFNLILPGTEIGGSILFGVVGIFTYSYFKKHMPGGEAFRRKKIKESRIILMYVTGFSIYLILTSTMSLLIN